MSGYTRLVRSRVKAFHRGSLRALKEAIVRFCILLLGLAALCGLGALIENGMPSGLVLALACAGSARALARMLPEGRRER